MSEIMKLSRKSKEAILPIDVLLLGPPSAVEPDPSDFLNALIGAQTLYVLSAVARPRVKSKIS